MLFSSDWKIKLVAAFVVATSALASPAFAASPEELVYRAYYLERETGDASAAAQLYQKALGARDLDGDLRGVAEARLASCREDIASTDLASLMPPNAFAYVEIGPVGDQIKALLDQLGILGTGNMPAATEQPFIAVSPRLIDAFLGIRGAALALDGFNAEQGKPTGVLVVHPGDIDSVRAVLETALPAGADPREPIGDFEVYSVENEVLIAVTRRLVIVSPSRERIEGVLERLADPEAESLADQDFRERFALKRGTPLVSFFVRTEPIMPMIQGLIAEAASHDPELAMANAMIDFRSIRSLAGHIGVNKTGISASTELVLDKGHQSMVFNLMRTPAIDEQALDHVPSGAAAFALASLNGLSKAYHPGGDVQGDAGQVVTGLDYGREFFANIASIALYVLPWEGARTSADCAIPDMAASILVNDPSKSELLWSQILGLCSMASGAATQESESITIRGIRVRVYPIEDKIALHFATVDQAVIVATSRNAMARSIATAKGEASIRKDRAFSSDLARLNGTTTKALFLHPGRCLELASAFMPEEERAPIKPFLPLLDDTVASLVVKHSNERLEVDFGIAGLPRIGGVLSQLIAAEKRGAALEQSARGAIKHKNWDAALSAIDEGLADHPGDARRLTQKFKVLVLANRMDDARDIARRLFRAIERDANELNRFAWSLLTERVFEGKFNDLALRFSERCNQIETDNWMYLDTLALARFVSGDLESAVSLEKRAMELAGAREKATLQPALDRFEGALLEKNDSLSRR